MRIGLLAGETSADNLGAEFMRQFRRIVPTVYYCGYGGEAMRAEGLDCLKVDIEAFGILEIVRKIPSLVRARRRLINYFIERHVDVFMGIDMPDFVIGIEEKLRRYGVKTVHFVSPTVWAWRSGRVQRFLRANDKILCIFPFECDVYQDAKAVFVGHPLAQALPMTYSRTRARTTLGLHQWIGRRKLIALLPGSRASEVERLLDPFMQTVELCYRQSQGAVCCLVSAANAERQVQVQSLLATSSYSFDIRIIKGESNDLIASADSVLVASGTASLQTMLIKRAMIIAYKVHPVTAFLFRLYASERFFGCVGMPNILANEYMVPEFVQEQVDPARMAVVCMEQLYRNNDQLFNRFSAMHTSLQSDYTAAQAVADLMEVEY